MENEGGTGPRLSLDPWGPAPILPQALTFPADAWAAAKQIDGLGGEWTHHVFLSRALSFHHSGSDPQFYEPFGDIDRFFLEVLLAQTVREHGVEPMFTPNISASITVYPSIFDSSDGVVPMPQSGETPIGAHAVAAIGLSDADTIVFQHGWRGWGRGDGIGFLTREYLESNAVELWVARRWNLGPTADTAELLLGGHPDTPHLWAGPRPNGATSTADPETLLKWHAAWSLGDERDAEVLTLEVPVPGHGAVRAGVAILVHGQDDDPPTSTLSDLHVWPPYRRRRLGTVLEQFAAERARVAGSTRLTAAIWAADMIKGGRAAKGFARSRGYTLQGPLEGQMAMFAQREIE